MSGPPRPWDEPACTFTLLHRPCAMSDAPADELCSSCVFSLFMNDYMASQALANTTAAPPADTLASAGKTTADAATEAPPYILYTATMDEAFQAFAATRRAANPSDRNDDEEAPDPRPGVLISHQMGGP